jgi:hypothetical protein
MTTLRALLTLVALSACAGAAQAQTVVTMEGRCEKLIIAGQDITQNCKEKMTNTVIGNRTSFDFSAWDGQSLSFGGNGAQQEATELTEQLQPINLVTPGQSNKQGVVRNPAPGVGSCKFSSPEPGKTQIACEANSQGKSYAATFITETKPKAAPKP